MPQQLPFESFWSAPGVILDVRSPNEYQHAHLPGSINLPLFNNEERALIGTTYKNLGKFEAIEKGLEIVGPKLSRFVAFAKSHSKERFVRVYCWRGGLRSSSMAWLLETAGFKTATLVGGYKSFRSWVLKTLAKPWRLKIVGGLTGSGKTEILHALEQRGEQILDLETLASHRGSTYGMIGFPGQPSNEQFENEIALVLNNMDPLRDIWVEDESRMIGRCKIPDPLYALMLKAPLNIVDCPKSERLKRLFREYGEASKEDLIIATQRLSRRLGSVRTEEIASLIRSGQLIEAMDLTLDYYDKTYLYALSRKAKPFLKVTKEGLSAGEWAKTFIEKGQG